MKNIFTLLVIVIGLHTAAKGQFRVGFGSQAIFETTTIGSQGKLIYESDNAWRIGSTFTYHFRKSNNWTIDLDGQYRLITVGESVEFYPLLGFSYNDNDVSNNLNFNGGVFVELPIGDYTFYIEPKYTFNKLNAFILSGGLLF